MNIFKKKNKDVKNASTHKVAIIDENSSFQAKEAYKTLRTNIMFSLPKNNSSKVVMFTSASPGEGKTTTLINLAISFVELGRKVILIDCDLRKPKIHRYSKIATRVGVSNILGGFAKVEDCIVKTDYGFDCIVAGHIPPNPSELLDSAMMNELIDNLRKSYEYILIDTPPVNIVSETAAIASKADGTVLLASYDKTSKPDFDRAISILNFSNAKILGFLLNNSKENSHKYGSLIYNNPIFKKIAHKTKRGYSYYYNYGYGYGYSYGNNYDIDNSGEKSNSKSDNEK